MYPAISPHQYPLPNQSEEIIPERTMPRAIVIRAQTASHIEFPVCLGGISHR